MKAKTVILLTICLCIISKTDEIAAVDARIVQETAYYLRGISTDLTTLANNINAYWQQEIPWDFPHSPLAFDAVYALTWGSSCTGHAHAGAALFRANGIPVRILLNMPSWATYFDHHWIIDYYVPSYGWVRMETSTGEHPCFAKDEIVTLACNPEDEFPMFYPCGIEGIWHTSDPELGLSNPDWGQAHSAYNICTIADSSAKIEQAHTLTDSLFFYYSHYWGIHLTPNQQTILENALTFQNAALANLKAKDLNGYIFNIQEALKHYKNIKAAPVTTIFFDDFESETVGWTHGGNHDEWE